METEIFFRKQKFNSAEGEDDEGASSLVSSLSLFSFFCFLPFLFFYYIFPFLLHFLLFLAFSVLIFVCLPVAVEVTNLPFVY